MTTPARAEALHLTGERTVPGIAEENYWFRRHEAAYVELLPYCAGASVLEAGCGEGYGAGLIAPVAERVLALDYDEPATAHVARRYPEVAVARTNLAYLPVRSSAVDVVANFQVIEHLWDQAGFLAECHRVLKPGGKLLVTTPNRLTFTPDSDTPLNPYHTRELSPAELDELLRDETTVTGVRSSTHSSTWSWVSCPARPSGPRRCSPTSKPSGRRTSPSTVKSSTRAWT
jgi:SAM-dependent methyltransferase